MILNRCLLGEREFAVPCDGCNWLRGASPPRRRIIRNYVTYATQAIISVSSCLAKRRLFCGFQKFKSVGFCVVCEFRGNYMQGTSKQISPSKIIRPLHESKLYVHYTNIGTPLPDKLLFLPQFTN